MGRDSSMGAGRTKRGRMKQSSYSSSESHIGDTGRMGYNMVL